MELEWSSPHRVIVHTNGKILRLGGEGLFDGDPDFVIYPSFVTHWEDGVAIGEDERARLLTAVVAEAAERGWKFEIQWLEGSNTAFCGKQFLCESIRGYLMNYLEAPAKLIVDSDAIFLAGGISGCPDWQSEAISVLRDTPYTVLNPRRRKFPAGDHATMAEQVAWEYKGLRMATVIAFWFHECEVQPIALYELGAAIALRKMISVGAHSAYIRRIDLKLQMEVAQVQGRVHNSLQSTISGALRLLENKP